MTIQTVAPETLITPGHPKDEADHYANVARRAGGVVRVPQTYGLQTEVLRFLQKNEIAIYPLEKVEKYMHKLIVQLRFKHLKNYRWYWISATQKDAYALGKRVYHRAIPLHALDKIALIREEFPKGVQFEITDYEVVRPDPFLSIVFIEGGRGGHIVRFVIDKWDEPGFKLF